MQATSYGIPISLPPPETLTPAWREESEVDEAQVGMKVGTISNLQANFWGQLGEIQQTGLSESIAIESASVLGHTDLMRLYYSAGSKAMKRQVAIESYTDHLKDIFAKVYDRLLEMIKRAIEWAKNLFENHKGPTAEFVKTAKASVDKLEPAAQEVEREIDHSLKTIIQAKGLDTAFFNSLTRTEYDIYAGGAWEDTVLSIINCLKHHGSGGELVKYFDGLNHWYENAHRTVPADPGSTEPIKTATLGKLDELFGYVKKAKEIEADSLGEAKPDDTAYNLAAWLSRASSAIVDKLDSKDFSDALAAWRRDLDRLKHELDRSKNETTGAIDHAERNSTEALVAVHKEYSKCLMELGAAVGLSNQAMATTMHYYNDSARLFKRMIVYVEKASAAYLEENESEGVEFLRQIAALSLSQLPAF